MKRIIAGILGIMLVLTALPVFAQEVGILVLENTPAQSVTLVSKGLPAGTNYTVAFADENVHEPFQDVARFNSASGGYVVIIVKIPENFAKVPLIRLRVSGSNGEAYETSFRNLPEKEGIKEIDSDDFSAPVAAESLLKKTCDYSVLPDFSVTQVSAGKSVTVEPHNFPAGVDFRVLIGVDTGLKGTPITYELEVCEGCLSDRAQTVHGIAGLSFEGTEVGTYRRGDGNSLTFQIPEEFAETIGFVLWFDEIGECGRYAYSYVWNTDASLMEPAP